MAATGAASQDEAPALLLGMAMNFLSADPVCKPGIDFSARHVLRLGVALLGLRITFAQGVDGIRCCWSCLPWR